MDFTMAYNLEIDSLGNDQYEVHYQFNKGDSFQEVSTIYAYLLNKRSKRLSLYRFDTELKTIDVKDIGMIESYSENSIFWNIVSKGSQITVHYSKGSEVINQLENPYIQLKGSNFWFNGITGSLKDILSHNGSLILLIKEETTKLYKILECSQNEKANDCITKKSLDSLSYEIIDCTLIIVSNTPRMYIIKKTGIGYLEHPDYSEVIPIKMAIVDGAELNVFTKISRIHDYTLQLASSSESPVFFSYLDIETSTVFANPSPLISTSPSRPSLHLAPTSLISLPSPSSSSISISLIGSESNPRQFTMPFSLGIRSSFLPSFVAPHWTQKSPLKIPLNSTQYALSNALAVQAVAPRISPSRPKKGLSFNKNIQGSCQLRYAVMIARNVVLGVCPTSEVVMITPAGELILPGQWGRLEFDFSYSNGVKLFENLVLLSYADSSNMIYIHKLNLSTKKSETIQTGLKNAWNFEAISTENGILLGVLGRKDTLLKLWKVEKEIDSKFLKDFTISELQQSLKSSGSALSIPHELAIEYNGGDSFVVEIICSDFSVVNLKFENLLLAKDKIKITGTRVFLFNPLIKNTNKFEGCVTSQGYILIDKIGKVGMNLLSKPNLKSSYRLESSSINLKDYNSWYVCVEEAHSLITGAISIEESKSYIIIAVLHPITPIYESIEEIIALDFAATSIGVTFDDLGNYLITASSSDMSKIELFTIERNNWRKETIINLDLATDKCYELLSPDMKVLESRPFLQNTSDIEHTINPYVYGKFVDIKISDLEEVRDSVSIDKLLDLSGVISTIEAVNNTAPITISNFFNGATADSPKVPKSYFNHRIVLWKGVNIPGIGHFITVGENANIFCLYRLIELNMSIAKEEHSFTCKGKTIDYDLTLDPADNSSILIVVLCSGEIKLLRYLIEKNNMTGTQSIDLLNNPANEFSKISSVFREKVIYISYSDFNRILFVQANVNFDSQQKLESAVYYTASEISYRNEAVHGLYYNQSTKQISLLWASKEDEISNFDPTLKICSSPVEYSSVNRILCISSSLECFTILTGYGANSTQIRSSSILIPINQTIKKILVDDNLVIMITQDLNSGESYLQVSFGDIRGTIYRKRTPYSLSYTRKLSDIILKVIEPDYLIISVDKLDTNGYPKLIYLIDWRTEESFRINTSPPSIRTNDIGGLDEVGYKIEGPGIMYLVIRDLSSKLKGWKNIIFISSLLTLVIIILLTLGMIFFCKGRYNANSLPEAETDSSLSSLNKFLVPTDNK